MKEQITNAYLSGYLNQKKVYYELYKKTFSGTTELNFKIYRVINYIGIPQKLYNLAFYMIKAITFIELPLSLFILVFRYLYLVVLKCMPKRRLILKNDLLLTLSVKEEFYTDLLKRAGFEEYDIIKIPFIKSQTLNHKEVSILDYISLKEITKSFIWALCLVVREIPKYSKNDCLFRFYSSFEYFLFYFFVNKNKNCRFMFFNTIDRWMYLFNLVDKKTIWIQHGILEDKDCGWVKVDNIKEAYFINESQRSILNNHLFNNEPISHILKAIKLDSLPYGASLNKPSVLLICNPFFWDAEQKFIKKFDYRLATLILKLHPKHPQEQYLGLQTDFPFIISEPFKFPKTDIVVSYKSTLADDYATCGIKVFVYTNVGDINKILDCVHNLIKEYDKNTFS